MSELTTEQKLDMIRNSPEGKRAAERWAQVERYRERHNGKLPPQEMICRNCHWFKLLKEGPNRNNGAQRKKWGDCTNQGNTKEDVYGTDTCELFKTDDHFEPAPRWQKE